MLEATKIPAMLDRNKDLLFGALEVVYKVTDNLQLSAYLFQPEALHPEQSRTGEKRSGILFFHSSAAWDHGNISQFAPHCLHFASRGMVALAVEYRTRDKHHTGPLQAMADARSAVRWLRMNAESLALNADHIAVAGGAAGGHIAAATVIKGPFDEPEENSAISCEPNAIILFNPILDTAKGGIGTELFPDAKTAKAASPLLQLRKKLPPAIIFHGTADRVVPVGMSEAYARKSRRYKNVCEFYPYEACNHGFFNFNVHMRHYETTLMAADAFLVQHGFLPEDTEMESQGVM